MNNQFSGIRPPTLDNFWDNATSRVLESLVENAYKIQPWTAVSDPTIYKGYIEAQNKLKREDDSFHLRAEVDRLKTTNGHYLQRIDELSRMVEHLESKLEMCSGDEI